MPSPFPVKVEVAGFGLIFATAISTWLLRMVAGGWKMGRLAREIEVEFPTADLPGFLERFHLRVAELGFTEDKKHGAECFLQGGEDARHGMFTHAKTLKRLRLSQADAGSSQVKVTLHLYYVDPIVADTGESAYRDAVLDYLSGKTDSMRAVSNQSFAAAYSFFGGIFAWLALPALVLLKVKPIWLPILMLTAGSIGIGFLAMLAVRQRPAEVTGRGLALTGIIVNSAASVLTIILTLLKII